jgi:hypothetical protein
MEATVIPDEMPTLKLPLPRKGTWLHSLAQDYPTAGDIRAARNADLVALPLVGRGYVKRLRELLSK